jgi:polyhydroxyalkanoate synthesis regulator phasin
MKNLIKDIAILLFAAGDEIQCKAEEFKHKREKRYKEMEDKIKNTRDDILSRGGFASKDDIDSLKEQIRELSAKLDTMSGNAS